jgi:hypothetical protein
MMQHKLRMIRVYGPQSWDGKRWDFDQDRTIVNLAYIQTMALCAPRTPVMSSPVSIDAKRLLRQRVAMVIEAHSPRRRENVAPVGSSYTITGVDSVTSLEPSKKRMVQYLRQIIV